MNVLSKKSYLAKQLLLNSYLTKNSFLKGKNKFHEKLINRFDSKENFTLPIPNVNLKASIESVSKYF